MTDVTLIVLNRRNSHEAAMYLMVEPMSIKLVVKVYELKEVTQ